MANGAYENPDLESVAIESASAASGDGGGGGSANGGSSAGSASGDPPTHGGVRQPDPDHIKMFVGQLPKSFSEEEVRRVFEEFGPIHNINLLRDKVTGQGKGCCFITYYTRKAALDAQNALHNVRTLSSMHNPIQMMPANTENRGGTWCVPDKRKLFVGMISKKSTEDDVRKMFSPHGVIEECTILRDSNGLSRGCAFVTFASRQNSLNAIRALHHSLTAEGCSSPLVVKMADTSRDKNQRNIPMTGMGNRGGLGASVQQSLNEALARQYCQTLLGSGGGGLNLAGLIGNSNPQAAGLLNGINLNLLAQLQQLQALTSAGGLNAGMLGSLAGANMGTSGNLGGGGSSSGTDIQSTLAALAAGGPGNAGGGMYGANSLMGGYGGSPMQAPPQQQQQNYGQGGQGQGSMASAKPPNGNPTMGGSVSGYPGGSSFSSLVGSPYGSSGMPYGNNNLSMDPSAYASSAVMSASGNSPGSRQPEGPENANLFIYHLPPEYGDAELVQLFSNFGQLISARVFIDKQTGLSKCFGFASYDNAASAAAAIATMNGFQIGSKRLKVQLKRARDNSKPY